MFKPAVRSNPTPLYYQVCTSIKKMILSGTYRLMPAADRKPTSEMFKVSKITARRGLGVVSGRRYRGTDSGQRHVCTTDDFEDERKVGLLLGFSEEMSQMGKKPGRWY